MLITEKKRKAGLEVIPSAGGTYVLIIDLPRYVDSVRGREEYRRVLKSVIAECEGRLGVYRRTSRQRI